MSTPVVTPTTPQILIEQAADLARYLRMAYSVVRKQTRGNKRIKEAREARVIRYKRLCALAIRRYDRRVVKFCGKGIEVF